MHQVSLENLKAAEKHALAAADHAKSIERYGKIVQAMGEEFIERGKLIEEYGKAAQKHIKASLEHVQAAQKPGANSTEEFIKASHEHLQESQLTLSASKEYSKIVEEQLNKFKKILNQHRAKSSLLSLQKNSDMNVIAIGNRISKP